MDNRGRLERIDWMRAARLALLEGGPSAVRVETLARKLRVSKGSFYWHFKNREALLEALLREWEEEKSVLLDLLAERRSYQALADFFKELERRVVLSERGEWPSDAAIFAWAAVSPKVARRANKEEETRIRLLKKLFGQSELGDFFYMAYLGFLLRRRRVPAAAKKFSILAKISKALLPHWPRGRQPEARTVRMGKKIMKRLLWVLILLVPCSAATQSPFAAPDRKPEFQEVQASSLYVPMRDGVRVAIDVLLPKGLSATTVKLPALFKISRFGRAAQDGGISDEDRFWVQHGYARVLIDERGTGASFGVSRYGPDTVPDLYDLVDWVVHQPWSNGRVGAIGVSVEGTASELLAATNHPAVRAVAPWFSDYNFYTDLVRPGGVFNDWLLKNFESFTLQMDSGDSAKRVDNDVDGTLVKQAIAEHRGNLDIYSTTKNAEFIDEPLAGTEKTLLDMSIPGTDQTLRKSNVPMLILASWYDAGTVQGTLQRFRRFSNTQRIFIGAWSHGAGFNADPFVAPGPAQPGQVQQRLEALLFFDHYLKDPPETGAPERQLSYYTIGEGRWYSTGVWPPKGLSQVTYYLNSKQELGAQKSGEKLQVKLAETSTGDRNRWRTQLGGNPVDYSQALEKMSALTSFTTSPLAAPLKITGQAVLHLRLICAQADPSVIAYLVAIDRKGTAFYITEGHLRLIHRKLNTSEQTLHTYAKKDAQPVTKDAEMEADLTLLPTSVLLPKGIRLRLLLASGDNATFATSGDYEAKILGASSLELPAR